MTKCVLALACLAWHGNTRGDLSSWRRMPNTAPSLGMLSEMEHIIQNRAAAFASLLFSTSSGNAFRRPRLDTLTRRSTRMSASTILQPPYTYSIDALAIIVEGRGRARSIWKLMRQGIDPLSDEGAALLTNSSIRALRKGCSASLVQVVGPPTISSCGTRKLLLRMKDGADVETVLIPTVAEGDKKAFTTLCVSSQVGCRQACRFCATGTMGLSRSLDLSEILAQLFEALKLVRSHQLPPIRNVVFMGMGEPLDNADVVQTALELMTDDKTFALSKKYITVSTVGPSPAHIEKMSHMPSLLAWSLHAADDNLRRLLVPTTRHRVKDLRDAFAKVLLQRPDSRGILIELTMIDGVNDALEHADQLVELIKPLPYKTRINLIPYNENAGLGISGKLFRASRLDTIHAFKERILAAGVICTIRQTRGDEAASACGQLVTKKRRIRRSDRVEHEGELVY